MGGLGVLSFANWKCFSAQMHKLAALIIKFLCSNLNHLCHRKVRRSRIA